MAIRPQAPRQGTVTSTVAVLVLAGCFAAPVLAASDRALLCQNEREADLAVAKHQLALTATSHDSDGMESVEVTATTIDSVATDHLLKPRVEATAREVFSEHAESETDAETALKTEPDDDEIARIRLHSLSQSQEMPFRRQMYRRDI